MRPPARRPSGAGTPAEPHAMLPRKGAGETALPPSLADIVRAFSSEAVLAQLKVVPVKEVAAVDVVAFGLTAC